MIFNSTDPLFYYNSFSTMNTHRPLVPLLLSYTESHYSRLIIIITTKQKVQQTNTATNTSPSTKAIFAQRISFLQYRHTYRQTISTSFVTIFATRVILLPCGVHKFQSQGELSYKYVYSLPHIRFPRWFTRWLRDRNVTHTVS